MLATGAYLRCACELLTVRHCRLYAPQRMSNFDTELGQNTSKRVKPNVRRIYLECTGYDFESVWMHPIVSIKEADDFSPSDCSARFLLFPGGERDFVEVTVVLTGLRVSFTYPVIFFDSASEALDSAIITSPGFKVWPLISFIVCCSQPR